MSSLKETTKSPILNDHENIVSKKVVLILCDTLRADRVNHMVMPKLFDLSERGIYYSMFFGDGGATKWSMPFFLCGQRVYDAKATFPGRLNEAGVHTSLVHSNAVLNAEKYELCFKEHIDTGVKVQPMKVGLRNRLKKTGLWTKTRPLRKALLGDRAMELPYRRARAIFDFAQIKLNERDSGFFWVHLMDPHIPYNPPGLSPDEKKVAHDLYEKVLRSLHGNYKFTKNETKHLMGLYNRECSYMDEEISKFVEANPDCLFIITSDHGEMFGETHSYSHDPHKHGMTLQLGHIPFIIYKEGIKPKVVFDYHSSVDVGPTVLDLFGVDPDIGHGRSMKKLIEGCL